MLFSCRKDKNSFLETCYADGIKTARRRYYLAGDVEPIWNYTDVVIQAILQINQYLETKQFETQLHARCWFFLALRSQAVFFRRHYKLHLSLNQQVSDDSATTFEDFIASRLTYPSLEDNELKGKVDNALKTLNKEEQDIVYRIWVQGLGVKDVAIALRKNEIYIKRILEKSKLKLARKLLACKD